MRIEGETINRFIEYYYPFRNIKTLRKDSKYFFRYNGFIYEFCPLIRKKTEIIEINRIINGMNEYDQIVKNIYNQLVTRIYEKEYILIRKTSKKAMSIYDIILNSSYIDYYYFEIDRSLWGKLWEIKIDNIEYQLSHIRKKYPKIGECADYYIGMSESAVIYAKKTVKNIKYIPKKISHIRINIENINDPQNIIIDYQSRDLAEYLKYMFLNNNYEYGKIVEVIYKLNYDEVTLKLLYARMFFPTFFFDLYDKIVSEVVSENRVLNLISRSEEYEDYINSIYEIINNKKKIPRIPWI